MYHHHVYRKHTIKVVNSYVRGGNRDRDRMVIGFQTTCAISAYHH